MPHVSLWEYYPAPPDRWLTLLAEGWHFAAEDDPLIILDFIPWNAYWPVILLKRDAPDGPTIR